MLDKLIAKSLGMTAAENFMAPIRKKKNRCSIYMETASRKAVSIAAENYRLKDAINVVIDYSRTGYVASGEAENNATRSNNGNSIITILRNLWTRVVTFLTDLFNRIKSFFSKLDRTTKAYHKVLKEYGEIVDQFCKSAGNGQNNISDLKISVLMSAAWNGKLLQDGIQRFSVAYGELDFPVLESAGMMASLLHTDDRNGMTNFISEVTMDQLRKINDNKRAAGDGPLMHMFDALTRKTQKALASMKDDIKSKTPEFTAVQAFQIKEDVKALHKFASLHDASLSYQKTAQSKYDTMASWARRKKEEINGLDEENMSDSTKHKLEVTRQAIGYILDNQARAESFVRKMTKTEISIMKVQIDYMKYNMKKMKTYLNENTKEGE